MIVISHSYASELSDEGEINISADKMSYHKAEERLEAEGNVQVIRGNMVINTENLTYDQFSDTVTATGGVTLSEDGSSFQGDEMKYNLSKEKVSITRGKIFIEEDNYHISGEKLVKEGGNKYSITDGVFTTCDGPSPSWLIKASKVDVEIGGYLFAKHARLHVKSIPVLYLPWMAAPLKTERQTGLLAPLFGYSDKDGFAYKQPFFWAISRSQDATITLNYLERRALGADTEYRYVRKKGSQGNLKFDYLYERRPVVENRWLASATHKEEIDNSLYLSYDLNAISDDKYLYDYGVNADIYSQQMLESSLSLVKNWQTQTLVTRFKYFRNLVLKEDTTLQRLPEITLTGKRMEIGETSFYFQHNSRFDNFWRNSNDKVAGRYSGQRLDFHPVFSLPLSPDYFEFTLNFGLRETLYNTDNHIERHNSRELYDFNAQFAIPFSRVFDLNREDGSKFKHTIEPELTYSYIPDVDQSDLPSYDSIDRIGETNRVRVILNNYITTKRVENDNAIYNRLIDFKLYSDYNNLEASRKLTFQRDKRRPWGDTVGQLKIKGEKRFTLDAEMRYHTYRRRPLSSFGNLTFNGENKNRFNISYRYNYNPQSSYLDSGFRYKIFDNISMAYRGRYSLEDSYFLENEYGAMLEMQCYSMTVTYSERKIPRERRVYFLINLKGLGALGSKNALFAN